jgi:hypothetical protein
MASLKDYLNGICYQLEGSLSPHFKDDDHSLKEDAMLPAKNYKLRSIELLISAGSPAPMPDKIFRLRTGPEKKMDAFRPEADEIPQVGQKFSPGDDAHGPEQFDVFYIKFEDYLSV